MRQRQLWWSCVVHGVNSGFCMCVRDTPREKQSQEQEQGVERMKKGAGAWLKALGAWA